MAASGEQGEALLPVDASRRLPLFRLIQLVVRAVSLVLVFASCEALQTGDGGGAMGQGVLAALPCLAPVVVTRTQRADAPWQVMRLDGWRLPFMIDLQAGHLDHRGLNRLVSQAKRLREGG